MWSRLVRQICHFLAHNVELRCFFFFILMLDEMVDKAADNEADKMVEEVAEIER